MRRISLVLTVVVVAIASTTMLGASALAQPEPETTVTPRTNLLDGQTVSVAGTDWPASTSLTVQECGYVPTFDVSCLSPQHVTTDTAGSFTTSYVVHRFVEHGDCVTTIDAQCVVRVALGDSSFVETLTIRFNIASSQGPDLIIKRRSDGKHFFDNYYTTSPAAYGHPIVDGKWVFAVLVQNDGLATTDITVHSRTRFATAPFTVQYFSGYYDVTALVTGSGFVLSAVAPGESRLLGVRFLFTGPPKPPDEPLVEIEMTVTTPRVSIAQDALRLEVDVPGT